MAMADAPAGQAFVISPPALKPPSAATPRAPRSSNAGCFSASGVAATAAAAAVAFTRQQRVLPSTSRRRVLCLRATAATASETDVQQKLLSEAWEHALLDREGNVFTEPELFAEILSSLNEPGEQKGPVYFERVSRAPGTSEDIVLYVPGIDFSGGFAAPQFRPLVEAGHELWRCWVGADNRTPFVEMVDRLEAWVHSQTQSGRQVVLFGESFGGLLSLAVALRLGNEGLKGLVLVNPATSFDRTIWPLLGRALTAVPNAPEDLPDWSPHQDMQDLFQDIQNRAILSPYPYLAGSALTGTVADSTQLGRLFSKIALNVLSPKKDEGGTNLDPSVENFLLYPENLAQLLPPETVRFRLRHWLRDGCEAVNSELRRRRGISFGGAKLPPTLLLASDSDRLLISDKEADRLRGLLQARCGDKKLQVVDLKDAGHAPLDSRVNVAKLLKESPIYEKPSSRNYVDDFNLPTLEKLEQGSKNIEPISALVSPVFCSWDAETNQRKFGLQGVPDPKELGRPVLLVGNHQLFALDLGPLVREFLIERGYAARGLAHPINFPDVFKSLMSATVSMDDPGFLDFAGLPFELRAAAKAAQEAWQELTGQGKKAPAMGPFGMGSGEHAEMEDTGELGVGENFGVGGAFAKWGAVPVTPRNFVRLLQRNEAILLFPGGAREACHGPTEKYQLFWPSETDFVRAAARFNAVIVPFGSIGSADNVTVSPRNEMSAKDREGWAKLLQGGGGMSKVSEALLEPPSFSTSFPRLPPATQTSPGFGDRFYFSFGKPVDLADVDPKDKDACEEVYAKVKGDVEGEIRWLLENRVNDPNRDFVRRQTLEQVMNLDPQPREVKAGPLKGKFLRSCGRRAPSFPLP